MAYLINRNPSGRLLCLHGILQYLVHHWGDGPYKISNLKFDASKSPDLHDFSPCATWEFGFPSCIYLRNPASLARCGLVNSVDYDPQKSKSASDIFNALDGLGLITRHESLAMVTSLGRAFIHANRNSVEWETLARKGVQNYGPFAGLTFLVSERNQKESWGAGGISLGFAETSEQVEFEGELVSLSTGSRGDTITRTRSSLIAWGIATGFFFPESFAIGHGLVAAPSQVKFEEYLMGPKWSGPFLSKDLVNKYSSQQVERPLSYDQLAKSAGSLREQGQELQRRATIRSEPTIKNRRLAIAYALHHSALRGTSLIFRKFVEKLSVEEDFVLNRSDFLQTMLSDLSTAFVIGTPFRVIDQDHLQGCRTVDLNVLTAGANPGLLANLEDLLDDDLFEG